MSNDTEPATVHTMLVFTTPQAAYQYYYDIPEATKKPTRKKNEAELQRKLKEKNTALYSFLFRKLQILCKHHCKDSLPQDTTNPLFLPGTGNTVLKGAFAPLPGWGPAGSEELVFIDWSTLYHYETLDHVRSSLAAVNLNKGGKESASPSTEGSFLTDIASRWSEHAVPQWRTFVSRPEGAAYAKTVCAPHPEQLLVVAIREEDFALFNDETSLSTVVPPHFFTRDSIVEGAVEKEEKETGDSTASTLIVHTFPPHEGSHLSLPPRGPGEGAVEGVQKHLYQVESTISKKKLVLQDVGSAKVHFLTTAVVLQSLFFQRWCFPFDFRMEMEAKTISKDGNLLHNYHHGEENAHPINTVIYQALQEHFDMEKYKEKGLVVFEELVLQQTTESERWLEKGEAVDSVFQEGGETIKDAFLSWIRNAHQRGWRYTGTFRFDPLDLRQFSYGVTPEKEENHFCTVITMDQVLRRLDAWYAEERRRHFRCPTVETASPLHTVDFTGVKEGAVQRLMSSVVQCNTIKQRLLGKFASSLGCWEPSSEKICPTTACTAASHVTQTLSPVLKKDDGFSFASQPVALLCKSPSLFLNHLLGQQSSVLKNLEDVEVCDIADGYYQVRPPSVNALKTQLDQSLTRANKTDIVEVMDRLRKKMPPLEEEWPEEFYLGLPTNSVGRNVALNFAKFFNGVFSAEERKAIASVNKETETPVIEEEKTEHMDKEEGEEEINCLVLDEAGEEAETVSERESLERTGVSPHLSQDPSSAEKDFSSTKEKTAVGPQNPLEHKVKETLFTLLPQFQSDIRRLSYLVDQFSSPPVGKTEGVSFASPVIHNLVTQFWNYLAGVINTKLNLCNEEDVDADNLSVCSLSTSSEREEGEEKGENTEDDSVALSRSVGVAADPVAPTMGDASAALLHSPDQDPTPGTEKVRTELPSESRRPVTGSEVMRVYLRYFPHQKTLSKKRNRLGKSTSGGHEVLPSSPSSSASTAFPWLHHATFLIAYGMNEKSLEKQMVNRQSALYHQCYHTPSTLNPPQETLTSGKGKKATRPTADGLDRRTLTPQEVELQRSVALFRVANTHYKRWLHAMITAKQVYLERWRQVDLLGEG